MKPPILLEHLISSRFLDFLERSPLFDVNYHRNGGFQPGVEIASWTETRGHYQLTEWKQSARRPGKMSSSDTNEGWFVLEGTLDFDVGAKHFSAVRGTFVFVPAETTHRAWNAGPAPARYLAIRSPTAPMKRTLP